MKPKSRPIRKELGENLVLTCRPSVPNPELISNLEWRDRKNRRIEIAQRNGPIYIQKLSGDVGIMLVFTGLTEEQSGTYSCHANYANTEPLSASVEFFDLMKNRGAVDPNNIAAL
ncbi:hypothetical protein HUJ05_000041 [Dendroctonus ponderosae]|nr:hypothetical protein HUJ05_000041 [Dendroctonus ponderosae]